MLVYGSSPIQITKESGMINYWNFMDATIVIESNAWPFSWTHNHVIIVDNNLEFDNESYNNIMHDHLVFEYYFGKGE